MLKSPSTAIKCELHSTRVSKVSSKLSVNFSKPFGAETNKEKQMYIFWSPLVIQNLYFVVGKKYLVFSMERNF